MWFLVFIFLFYIDFRYIYQVLQNIVKNQYCPRKKHQLQPPLPFTGTECLTDGRDNSKYCLSSKKIK
jgi:hypothetical protein